MPDDLPALAPTPPASEVPMLVWIITAIVVMAIALALGRGR